MESMRAHFEREADLDSPWTSYNASLGRPLLNTAKFLAAKPAPDARIPDEGQPSLLPVANAPTDGTVSVETVETPRS
jgi:hypothetical protein